MNVPSKRLVLVALVVLAAGVWYGLRPAPKQHPIREGLAAPEQSSAVAEDEARPSGPGLPVAENTPRRASRPPSMVTLLPSEVLATINGVPVTLKDLLPLSPGQLNTQQEIPVETYEYLLARALDRELTFAGARARGLELTESQKQSLRQIQEGLQIRETGQFYSSHEDPAKVDLTLRDFTALLLQDSLLAGRGVPSAVSEEQVVQYYYDHKAELGELPEDPSARLQTWQRINVTIRQHLQAAVRANHQTQLRRYLDELKAVHHVAVVKRS